MILFYPLPLTPLSWTRHCHAEQSLHSATLSDWMHLLAMTQLRDSGACALHKEIGTKVTEPLVGQGKTWMLLPEVLSSKKEIKENKKGKKRRKL